MELWLVFVQPALEWHVTCTVRHFRQDSREWLWACTVSWIHRALACVSRSYICFLLSLWSWASLLASFSLVPTYVKDEDALSKCEEDSVKCEHRTLILFHRKTPTREFGASHFLPLLPFLYLHSCESQQGWRQQRDEHVWAPPQCSRELYPHPQPQVEGASPTENCPVHCMLFCPCCTLLQALCTYFRNRWPISSAILNVFVHGKVPQHTA